MEDIDFMQSMPNENMFQHSYELFKRKYQNFEGLESFFEEFEIKRIRMFTNWHEGAEIFTPSTNNAIESFNKQLKHNYLKIRVVYIPEFIAISAKIFECGNLKLVGEKPNYEDKHKIIDFILIRIFEFPFDSNINEYIFLNSPDKNLLDKTIYLSEHEIVSLSSYQLTNSLKK